MKYIKAHKSRLHGKRNRNSIKYIVIHYTSNVGDTALNNAMYFKRLDNPKNQAGAHFFVDDTGECIKSIPMNQIAWSVGGCFDEKAPYYNVCTNANSVSIELANLVKGDVKAGHYIGLRKAIRYIKKYCKNAKIIIRHYDVNGKHCPDGLLTEKKWSPVHRQLMSILEGC